MHRRSQLVLDPEDPVGIERFLESRGWLPAGARLTGLGRAGDGNMNLVLRITWADADADGSLILKQARPWVEKFPDIAAPPGRLAVETDFYRCVAGEPMLARGMPELIAFDEEASAALLEDLGPASDYSGLYAGGDLPDAELDALLAWLSRLHRFEVDAGHWPRLANREMRELNHAHIFVLPFGDEAPDADGFSPGLAAAAAPLRRDPVIRRRLAELGAIYLEDGTSLLHGDFYPGSWLATEAGPRIIDPEFGFLGRAEFDLGVLAAHLHFAGLEDADLSAHEPPAGFDPSLARAFTGAELLRRLLGVAQLPLEAEPARRRQWLEAGVACLLD
jgi:5-methylthioribose kinase